MENLPNSQNTLHLRKEHTVVNAHDKGKLTKAALRDGVAEQPQSGRFFGYCVFVAMWNQALAKYNER